MSLRPSHSLFDIGTLAPLIEQGITLLTPNLRLARRINIEWNARQVSQGVSVWAPVRAHPVEHWLRERWQFAVRAERLEPLVELSKGQELQLWQQIILQRAEAAGSPSLLNTPSAAELASRARDTLVRWQIPLDERAIRQLFELDIDCETFAHWLDAFNERLATDGLGTPADCHRALAQLDNAAEPTPLALIECGELSPLVQCCIARQGEQVPLPQGSTASFSRLLHAFNDPREELAGVADWAAKLHRSEPGTTIGIVVGDDAQRLTALEYQLRAAFNCLGENYTSLPVNFSAGISLSHAPVARDALRLLSLCLEHVPVTDVAAVLRSRFTDMPDAGSPLANHLLERLYESGSVQISVGLLRSFAQGGQGDEGQALSFGERMLVLATKRELRQDKLPSAWVPHFRELLDMWGWPGQEPLDSLEYQQVSLWYQLLDDFRALDAVMAPVSFANAIQLLRDSCNRQVSHPETVDSPVQVLGPLEAAGLSFDHLWLCGMQAGSWPAPARPNPFIPLSLQRQRDMPHATPQREWDYASDLLAQYERACRNLHASYSRQTEGVPDLPSALVEAFEPVLSQPLVVQPAESWREAYRLAQPEVVDDAIAPSLSHEQAKTVRGGASIIEHQSRCPFSAMAQFRLGVRPLPEPFAGLSPAERGKLVHAALHELWQQLGTHSALSALDKKSCSELVQRVSSNAVGREIADHRRIALGESCLSLEQEHLQVVLQQWLEIERQRGAFQVAALEEGVDIELSQLQIRLRIDRIDRLADGSLLVMDYKTGKSALSEWYGERPSKPQLLLYGLALESPPAALAFAQVRAGENKFVGLGTVEDIAGVISVDGAVKSARGSKREWLEGKDWTALNIEWQSIVKRLAAAFVAGDAVVDPLDGACTWCGLQPLCRIEARTVLLAEDQAS